MYRVCWNNKYLFIYFIYLKAKKWRGVSETFIKFLVVGRGSKNTVCRAFPPLSCLPSLVSCLSSVLSLKICILSLVPCRISHLLVPFKVQVFRLRWFLMLKFFFGQQLICLTWYSKKNSDLDPNTHHWFIISVEKKIDNVLNVLFIK